MTILVSYDDGSSVRDCHDATMAGGLLTIFSSPTTDKPRPDALIRLYPRYGGIPTPAAHPPPLCNTYSVGLCYATPDSASSTSPDAAPSPAHDARSSAASTSAASGRLRRTAGRSPDDSLSPSSPRLHATQLHLDAPAQQQAMQRATVAPHGASSAPTSSTEQRSCGASHLPSSSGPAAPHLLHRCTLRGPCPLHTSAR
jgi:hypothetical protein